MPRFRLLLRYAARRFDAYYAMPDFAATRCCA